MALLEVPDDLAEKLRAYAAEQGIPSINHVLDSLLAQSALGAPFCQAVLEHMSDTVLLTDDQGEFVMIYSNVQVIFGYTEAEVRAMGNIRHLLGPLNIEPLVTGGEITNLEHMIRTSDGQTRALLINIKAVTIGAGTRLYTCRDIGDRQRAHDEMRQFKRAVEQSPSIVMITDTTSVITYVNPRFTRLTGYTPAEVLGKRSNILKSGQTPVEVYEELWRTISAGQDWQGEFINKKKNGDLYWERASISPIFDAEGQITHYVSIQEDITERKTAEAALRASETRYQALFERTNDAVFIFDLEMIHRHVNQQAADMLGYTIEEIVGQHIATFVVPDEQDAMTHQQTALGEGQILPIYERRMQRKDGRIITVEVNAALVYDESSQPSHYQSILRDVTERKQLETDLRASKNRIQAIVDAIPDLILRFDATGMCIEQIPTQSNMLPFSQHYSVAGKRIAELTDLETANAIQTAIQAALKTGELRAHTYERMDDNATTIHEEIRLIPEGPDTVLAFIRNITARKTAELALIHNERDAREFQDYLKVMVRLNGELANCADEDSLLSHAVELGHALFDFDRLNIFLFDETTDSMVGVYGIDVLGQVQSKRDFKISSAAFKPYQEQVLSSLDLAYLWSDVDLTEKGEIVGRGWHAVAAITDGDRFIGAITADNLLRQQPPRPFEAELLALYATTLGNLLALRHTADRLQNNERIAREFLDYLKILHDINLQLANATSLDDLCRQAVELGVQRLDLGRVGLFVIRSGDLLCGTYGTSPQGDIRSEHNFIQHMEETGRDWQSVLQGPGTVKIWHDAPLLEFGQTVGQGWYSLASMGTEDDLIGGLATDNLIHQQPPRPYEAELISLYSALLGHLITRLQREESLQASETRFRTLMEAAPVAILMVNTAGRIIQVNRQAADIFGYRQAEFSQLALEDLMPDEFRARHRLHRTEFFDEPRSRPVEMGAGLDLWGRRRDGTAFPISAALNTIETDDGTLALAYIMDDTLRRETQQQKINLQLAQERAAVLSTFIRDSAHEFRTPLAIIQTNLYMLNRVSPSEKMTETTKKIQTQADNILKLVEALTTMTRLDNETQDDFHPINPHVVLRTVLDQHQNARMAKQLDLIVDLVESVPMVNGDAADLGLALNALLENAIRYTPPEGIITVRTTVQGNQLKIAIQDTGKGMTPEVLVRAFEHFFRADTAHSTRGFGLGLTIARKIIENHRGQITAESEPGVGSIFTVTLPIAK